MTELIAELCQNHNGSRKNLEEMVKTASESGADYAKIQTIFADDLTPRGRFETGETGNNIIKTMKRPYKPEYERLKELELTEDDHRYFIELCDEYGITPLTTVFSRKRIPMVASLPWPESVVKIGSFDCASKPMLRELAEEFDRLLISTGGTFDEEIKDTAEMLSEMGANYTFLHCVTSYPTKLEMSHLSRMEWLQRFTQTIGWSDHTLVERDGILAAKAAIALGADIIERHFTILEPEESKDGPVSITPELLSEMREFADKPQDDQLEILKSGISDRDIDLETLKGRPHREMTHQEVLNRDYYRGRFASYDHQNQSWVYNWEGGEIIHE